MKPPRFCNVPSRFDQRRRPTPIVGTIRFFQGRYTDAVAAFEKAVELSANSHLYWGDLGDGYRWAPGKRADAPAAYRRASELIQQQIAKQQGDSNLESRHAVYLVKSGDTSAALKMIEGVVVRPNLTPQILFRSTVVFELAGARDRALASLRRALEAGYAVADVASDPELTALRTDARYRRLVDAVVNKPAKPSRGSGRGSGIRDGDQGVIRSRFAEYALRLFTKPRSILPT